MLKDVYPKDLPFGQGSDFAGRVESVGSGVKDFARGDAVMGWTDDRAAQADYVAVTADHLIAKPLALDWYRAGSMMVVASTASAAVKAVNAGPGDTVAISNAAGANAGFLRSVGAEHVAHGDGLEQRLRDAAPKGISAFIDLFGGGYLDTAVALGIAKDRIDTIIDFEGAKRLGVKAEGLQRKTNGKIVIAVEASTLGSLTEPSSAKH